MFKESLSFDDVMLIPKYSEIESRSSVNLSVKIDKINQTFDHPIIAANMKTIISLNLLSAVQNSNGLSILHRYEDDPFESQMNLLEGRDINRVGFSIGVKKEDYDLLDKFVLNGVKIINIDVAHGDSKLCVDMCSHIKNKYPEVLIIAGNIATGSGAERLWRAGADVVRVGVGNGSICTTRIETGNGVPQLTSLMEVFLIKDNLEKKLGKQLLIISDGGASKVGDLCKGLCFADFIMTGNMFSGCIQTPGEIISIDGMQYKRYVGSSTHKSTRVEGVEALVPVKESYTVILRKMLDGIQSCCSYQGVSNLIDLKRSPEFVKISAAGLRESHAHDVKVIK